VTIGKDEKLPGNKGSALLFFNPGYQAHPSRWDHPPDPGSLPFLWTIRMKDLLYTLWNPWSIWGRWLRFQGKNERILVSV